MMKLLLLPFRVVFYFLRLIFFPWYLRWLFRMHWMVYFAIALGIGSLAYQEYENYRFTLLEAELQIADGPPDVIPLSKWTDADNTPYNGEVVIRGIYFTALTVGEFDSIGLKRQFILLADDQGREVKAVLVVRPADLARLQRQLAAQGSGDRIPVTVNGSLSADGDWRSAIRTELQLMNVPQAQDLVIVEPFIGDRATAITDLAEKAFGTVSVLGFLAGLLALFGLSKLLFGRKRGIADTVSKTHQTARGAQHLHEKPKSAGIPEASPWGTFQPITAPPAPPEDRREDSAKAQNANPTRDRKKPLTKDAPPLQPHFKSVFPGGGSSFRFKSADQIILQAFGTLSTLKPSKQDK